MLYVFALTFGLQNYFSRMLPLPIIHPLSLTPILALVFNLLNYKLFFAEVKAKKIFLITIISFFLLSIIRYFCFYESLELTPIFRQFVSIFLGLNIFFSLKILLKNYNLKSISNAFLITSYPFLLIGVKQKLDNLKIGEFPRISSLFSEPSYYGDYLVLVLIPFALFNLFNLNNSTKLERINSYGATVLIIFNLYALQSGTAILKLVTLIFLTLIFYPMAKRNNFLILSCLVILNIAVFFIGESYTKALVLYLYDIIQNPDQFFKIHTFYDRIYPLYSSLVNLPSLSGLIGLGFGGDYYEFKNLYPPETHEVMIATKPSLSYFNSLASKIILYFGIPGLYWYYTQGRKIILSSTPFLKICFGNILLISIIGIPNFSLPYLWLWMALIENHLETNQNLSFQF